MNFIGEAIAEAISQVLPMFSLVNGHNCRSLTIVANHEQFSTNHEPAVSTAVVLTTMFLVVINRMILVTRQVKNDRLQPPATAAGCCLRWVLLWPFTGSRVAR